MKETITDAGHKYGWDTIAPGSGPSSPTLGFITQNAGANAGARAVGESFTNTIVYSGGYKVVYSYVKSSPDAVTIIGAITTRTDTGEVLDTLVYNHVVISIANPSASNSALGDFSQDDTYIGNSFANALSGAGGNDTLEGGGGNDTLNGGAGTDTAIFHGNLAQYARSQPANALQGLAVVGPDGSDSLFDIERLRFDDASWPMTQPVLRARPIASTRPLSIAPLMG